jgi:TatD DNase family protein
LIDSHAHLDDARFDADREQVLARARAGGVELMITIGADLESSRQSVALAEGHPFVYAAVGIHPHDAPSLDDAALATLREWAHHPRVAAIGEIGLDYYRDLSPRLAQQAAFERQLDLAAELGKPVIVHARDADQDLVAILDRWADRLRGVLHCFSGDAALAARVVEWGWYIGVDGPVTFQNARQLPDVVRSVPLSRLLLETDSPYLTPHPYRGRRNEPAYLVWVADAVAKLKGVSLAEVERVTSQNARGLFGLDTVEVAGRI